MKYKIIVLALFSLAFASCVSLRERKVDKISSDLIVIDQDREKYVPIPVDREDGFYETVDYVPGCEPEDVQLEETPVLTPADMKKVYKEYNTAMNQPEIAIVFSSEASEKFRIITGRNINKPIAIVLDKHIVSIPIVTGEIFGGRACISGDFSEDEIDRMIKILSD